MAPAAPLLDPQPLPTSPTQPGHHVPLWRRCRRPYRPPTDASTGRMPASACAPAPTTHLPPQRPPPTTLTAARPPTLALLATPPRRTVPLIWHQCCRPFRPTTDHRPGRTPASASAPALTTPPSPPHPPPTAVTAARPSTLAYKCLPTESVPEGGQGGVVSPRMLL